MTQTKYNSIVRERLSKYVKKSPLL